MNKIDRILLIDDDNITNFLNVRLIKKLNLASEIKITNNGEEALAYLNHEKFQPPLIFLDINMPVMNGIDFIKSYKRNLKKSKGSVIIVLSSSNNNKDLEQLKSSDAIADFLIKPLTEEKVSQVLNKYFS